MATVRQLEALRAVIDYGTVTAAADALGLSQPSVSKSISLLEHSTGLKLFERRRRRLYPTAEAMTLYGEVDKMFLSLTRIVGMSRELKSLTTGQVSIVASPVLGFNLLPDCIGSFRSDHPNANISLHVHDAGVVVQWIIAQQADVGFGWNSIDHPAVSSQPLCELEAVLAMPVDHPLTKRKVCKPSDLENETFLSFSRDTRTRHNIDTMLDRYGISVNSPVEAYMSESLCAMVSYGSGISLVNPLSAETLETRGLLATRRFEPAIIMPLRTLRPRNRPKSMMCDRFVEHTREQLSRKLSANKLPGKMKG
ncbi:LysR substrate-binding domain-containing protein [Thalassospiraceae bacterium LMO-JJ14]|nr:LysR substrate-binding domain-containing protein [Thalassospiraceae bacterium LMO-JJ14]